MYLYEYIFLLFFYDRAEKVHKLVVYIDIDKI